MASHEDKFLCTCLICEKTLHCDVLQEKEKKVLMIVIPLHVLANVASIVMSCEGIEGGYDYFEDMGIEYGSEELKEGKLHQIITNDIEIYQFEFDNRKMMKRTCRSRPSEKSKDLKEAAEHELLMKGPGTFSLERLLAIFQCITSVGEDSLDGDEEGFEGLDVEGGSYGLMSDVLLLLSSI